MARMDDTAWAEARALWEKSPRQGLTWLTREGGGPFDVSAEAIRKRRTKEDWRKVELTADVVEAAHRAADRLAAERLKAGTGPDQVAADSLVGYAKNRLKAAETLKPDSPDSSPSDQSDIGPSRAEIAEAA